SPWHLLRKFALILRAACPQTPCKDGIHPHLYRCGPRSSRQGCKSKEVQVLGAADKAACLRRWKSSCRQLPVRTASISDASEGNDRCSARTYTPRLPSTGGYCGGSDLGGSKPRGLNMRE